MIITSLPLLLCILGLIVWLVASRPSRPWAELGKITFAIGLFFTVWRAAEMVKLL